MTCTHWHKCTLTTVKMRYLVALALCALCILHCSIDVVQCENVKQYDGYMLYRSTPKNKNQLEKLKQLMDDELDDGELQFWREPNSVDSPVDILASPEQQDRLSDKLYEWGIPTHKIVHDLGKIIRRSSNRIGHAIHGENETDTLLRSVDSNPFHTQFQTYDQIKAKIRSLSDNCEYMDARVVGKTSNQEDLWLIRFSKDPSAQKPVILIDAGHHAREWISHSTIMYLIHALAADSDNSEADHIEKFRSFLDKYDFWFVPVVNPDGYIYSHNYDRFWRKNRSGNSNYRACRGTDINRNYPSHWMEIGASSDPCSDIHAGPRAGSEFESQVIINTIKSLRNRGKMYLSLHSYGGYLLTPFGWQQKYPDNWDDIYRVANAGAQALRKVRGTRYKIGPSSIALYPASGSSDDYAYDQGFLYSYTMELPGPRGFVIAPSEILPVARETLVGLNAMLDALGD